MDRSVHLFVRLRPEVAKFLGRCIISILLFAPIAADFVEILKHGPIVALRVLQKVVELARFPPLLDLIELIIESLFDFAIDQRLDL